MKYKLNFPIIYLEQEDLLDFLSNFSKHGECDYNEDILKNNKACEWLVNEIALLSVRSSVIIGEYDFHYESEARKTCLKFFKKFKKD